jgi:hypothetical protein
VNTGDRIETRPTKNLDVHAMSTETRTETFDHATFTERHRTGLLLVAGLGLLAAAVWTVESITSGPDTPGGHDRGGAVTNLLSGTPDTETLANAERAHDLLNEAVWGRPDLAEVQPEACRASRRAAEAAQDEADQLPDGTTDKAHEAADRACADLGEFGSDNYQDGRIRHDAVENLEHHISGRDPHG